MRMHPTWRSGSGPRWSRPTSPGTASFPWPPASWGRTSGPAHGPFSIRWRTWRERAPLRGLYVMVRKALPEGMQAAIDAIEDLKAQRLVVLDLRGLNDATDFFISASGTSDAHVRGIAESVIDKMSRQGFRTHHIEGITAGRWVLLDFVDFVVHLFHPETRAFYQLERLWNDAPELLTSSS